MCMCVYGVLNLLTGGMLCRGFFLKKVDGEWSVVLARARSMMEGLFSHVSLMKGRGRRELAW